MRRSLLFRRLSRTRGLVLTAVLVIIALVLMRKPADECPIIGWNSDRTLPEETAIELLVDSNEFMERLESDLASARDHVYIQTMSFEGDTAGKRLAVLLKSSSAPDKKLLVDDYSRFVVNDKFKFFPKYWRDRDVRYELERTESLLSDLCASGIPVRLTNPVDPFLVRFIARNHKKLIIVDREISYIGGINFCDHNFAWHDMMIRIRSEEVADFLKHDFTATWNGTDLCAERDFGGLWLAVIDGNSNHAGFAPVLGAIDAARHSIIIESAYLSFPFFSYLRDAHRRGVRVVILTPAMNNKPIMKQYILWEALKAGFEVRLYPERMNHLKAILIDDSTLIFGSSNFDYISHAIQQEILACIIDQDVISTFKKRVLDPDLDRSEIYSVSVSPLGGWPRFAVIKGMGTLLSGLNRLLDRTVGSTRIVEWKGG